MQVGAGELGDSLEVAAASAIARIAFGRKWVWYAVLSYSKILTMILKPGVAIQRWMVLSGKFSRDWAGFAWWIWGKPSMGVGVKKERSVRCMGCGGWMRCDVGMRFSASLQRVTSRSRFSVGGSLMVFLVQWWWVLGWGRCCY